MADTPPHPAGMELELQIAALRQQLTYVQEIAEAALARQVIRTADNILAIRHRLGWLFVPEEDYASIAHLADGVSGHELGTQTVIAELVKPGDTVVDLGAHIGLMSLPMCKLVGPKGRVIAVEPMPRTATCLHRALVCNGMVDRCQLVVAAASDRNGTVDFYLGANSMMGSLIPAADDQQSIEVREARLDDIVPAGTIISLIKMDVEGAELTALSGAERVIADNDELILIAEFGPSHLERVGVEPADWFAAFSQAGFRHRFAIDEATGKLRPVNLKKIESVFSVNILFSRSNQRLKGQVPATGRHKAAHRP